MLRRYPFIRWIIIFLVVVGFILVYDASFPFTAVYLVQGEGQLSKNDLSTHPEVYVTNTFSDIKQIVFHKIAIWIDINSVGLVDRAWLDRWPQKYYPIVVIGTSDALCAFRDILGGFGIIEGPPADCTVPQPGFSVWKLRYETLNSASAFMHGYEQDPNPQSILEITNLLLMGRDPLLEGAK